jgi:hypothetical protein
MASDIKTTPGPITRSTGAEHPFYRFLVPHLHLQSVFGDDWFALKAEAFARFFGTPTFLIAQTVIVAIWIIINVLGLTTFDIYPFILLNLAFSLQAAYAAPLILLAQTRQADRDAAQPWPMRNIVRLCTSRARNGKRSRRSRRTSWSRC